MKRSVIGLDIGGANLKAAHSAGTARLQSFALWKNPAGLPAALRALLAQLPQADSLAVTMTGELCDCFENKRQGVRAILDAVDQASKLPVSVWQTDGRFVTTVEARERPLRTAAANWLALATFVGRFAPIANALLVDIGSTTTDIVPLADGVPLPRGRTDPERLRNQELLYTGVRRTPVCALLGPAGAAEFFATTQDVYLLLGKQPDNADDLDTADGRPATQARAHERLARMLCADLETSTEHERRNLALRVANRQAALVRQTIERVAEHLPQPIHTVILAGSGEFLARAALDLQPEFTSRLTAIQRVVSLHDQLGPAISQAACAHALAVLATEADHG